jgi:hypothetical protein
MRTSLAILAAAAIGMGGAAAVTSPASAATLTPLVYDATSADRHVGPIEVGHGGWHHGHRWHRHRDRSAAAGIIGLGAGLLLGHALSAPRTGYYAYGHPQYHYYGGHPQYRVYGGYPQYRVYGGTPQFRVFGGNPQDAPGTIDSRAPHNRP